MPSIVKPFARLDSATTIYLNAYILAHQVFHDILGDDGIRVGLLGVEVPILAVGRLQSDRLALEVRQFFYSGFNE